MSATVYELPRREQGPSQEVAGRVATTRETHQRAMRNLIFHDLDRQTRALVRLAKVLPASDVATSYAFHFELARARLARVGIT